MKNIFILLVFMVSFDASASFVRFNGQKSDPDNKAAPITNYVISPSGIRLETDGKSCFIDVRFINSTNASHYELVKLLEQDSSWIVNCEFIDNYWRAFSIGKK